MGIFIRFESANSNWATHTNIECSTSRYYIGDVRCKMSASGSHLISSFVVRTVFAILVCNVERQLTDAAANAAVIVVSAFCSDFCVGDGKFTYPIIQSVYNYHHYHYHAMHAIENRFSFAISLCTIRILHSSVELISRFSRSKSGQNSKSKNWIVQQQRKNKNLRTKQKQCETVKLSTAVIVKKIHSVQ